MPIDDADDMPISQEGRTCAIHPMMDDLAPLTPLLEHLRAGGGAPERLTFTRGVLLPDGRLDLCKQGVGPHGAAALRIALRGSRHVRDILLGADHLGVAGAGEVAGVISERPELRTVYMGCNAVGAEGAEVLASALRENRSVRALWVKRNHLGVDGAKAIASMLRENDTLRTIDLVSNEIGVAGVEAIFASLAAAHAAGRGAVQLLYLCGNGLGAEGAKIIAKYLPSTGLRALYLGGNHLGDEGAMAIAGALKLTPALQVIGLSSNAIGETGARAIAEAATGHPALESIELGYLRSTDVIGATANHYGDLGARALCDLVRTSATLTSLDLTGSGVTIEGATALIEAIPSSSRIASLPLGLKLPAAIASRLSSVICRNANRRVIAIGEDDWKSDIARIKSVYRTATSVTSAPVVKVAEPEVRSPSADEIETCARVLRTLHALGGEAGNRVELGELIALSHEVARSTRKTEWGKRARARARSVARDLGQISRTGIRRGRVARIVPAGVELPPPAFAVPDRSPIDETTKTEESVATSATSTSSTKLARSRGCYVCKRSYQQLDAFYDQLCPTCAALNREKRDQTADLRGRVALLTGGRIKIGFRLGLKLLRAGARVIVTTRFPFDAARRYEAEPDAACWRDRLEIHAIDLRFLSEVERFGVRMSTELPRLDVLIHNAAQTIARPPGFHADLIAAEERASQVGHALVHAPSDLEGVRRFGSGSGVSVETRDVFGLARSEAHPDDARLFPSGSDDGHGQPLDLRDMNSWRLRVGEISTAEIVSVHAVTSLAPFVLTNALRDLLVKSARDATPAHSFVVNVSAVEAQFHRAYKSPFHPHTNMAKAGLNMMARTVAEDFAAEGVLINAVDTGWITNENPFPISEAMAGHGFQPPLDEEDGAARVLDPVFSVLRGGPVVTGAFLKDYLPAPW